MALKKLIVLALAALAQGLTFELEEVKEVVDEIKVKYAEYFHYDGSANVYVNESASVSGRDVLEERQGGAYWYEQIAHRGIAATGPAGYQVYRNGELLLVCLQKRSRALKSLVS